jgi:cell division protease FtsH
MKKFLIFTAAIIAVGILVSSILNRNIPEYDPHYEISYSDFIEDVRNKVVTEVDINGNNVEGKRNNGTRFSTYNPNDSRLIDELLEYGVKIKVEKPPEPSTLMNILISWAPTLLLIAVLVYFMRKQSMMSGGRDGQMGFGKSRAKLMEEDQVKVRFSDVAGVEEAKEDVVEMVDFLKDPGKYEALGGKIPRGVLMVGPPGTGKTLLARAIAGEAVNILSDGNLDESPSFAPNGSMILFAANKGGRSLLSVVSTDGAMQQKLDFHSGGVREPAWAP